MSDTQVVKFTYTNSASEIPSLVAGCAWNKKINSDDVIFLQHATGFCKVCCFTIVLRVSGLVSLIIGA